MGEVTRLFVDNLTVIDCSYLHPQRGLLGESWIVDIELTGELDEQGMVFDFGHVKKLIKSTIDDTVDHKLVVPTQNAGVSVNAELTELRFEYANGKVLEHKAPVDALCLVEADSLNATNVARYTESILKPVLPSNVLEVKIQLRTEQIDGELYHYSHGLKKHLGNCQRIAHGHRSTIHVLLDGQRSVEHEKQIATEFSDIYIATQEDLIGETDSNYQFAYTAQQGRFEISLDKRACYFMDSDTTVELIAHHLQSKIGGGVTVRAFEGVGKGAVAGPAG